MKKLDFHVHIDADISTDESARYFRDMRERHGYEGVAIMSIYRPNDPCEPTCNEKALALKERLGSSYAFAALLPDEDFALQAEKYMRSGFDGIKLIRGGKPNHHRRQGFAYDDVRYDEFFSLAEERQIPIMMHVNDPAYSWDITKATKRAIEQGWVYDESYPSHEFFYSVVDRVLNEHPRLNLALAHMGFYTEDLGRAVGLLEKYEGLKLDITPALNIYFEMSEYPEVARDFFVRYHDRLIFGTDASNELVGGAREYNDKKNLITSTFLAGKYLSEQSFESKIIRPIGLEEELLECIYYKNALDFISSYRRS